MIPTRPLGHRGPAVGRIGYGAMGLEGYYGAADGEEQAIATIHRALDAGMTMIDTADAYGNGHNETLLSRVLRARRREAFVATKFGIVFSRGEASTDRPTAWGFPIKINGTPAYARRALDASLARLGVDAIDLWYLHFPDPATPIEESVGGMAEAVRAGKVHHLGLSNVTAAQLRRAHAIHPIAAVQYEYSLWRREAETELLPTLRELGVALVAWSPLGAGFLTGVTASLGPEDFRNLNPRYAAGNLQANRDRFAPLAAIAAQLAVTPAQLALAWLLHQGGDVFPIPGTRRAGRVVENAAAAALVLPADVLARIDEIAPPGAAAGAPLV
jgi:aryl-alcohol dehydrogenase-like predicted oxidoreductase